MQERAPQQQHRMDHLLYLSIYIYGEQAFSLIKISRHHTQIVLDIGQSRGREFILGIFDWSLRLRITSIFEACLAFSTGSPSLDLKEICRELAGSSRWTAVRKDILHSVFRSVLQQR